MDLLCFCFWLQRRTIKAIKGELFDEGYMSFNQSRSSDRSETQNRKSGRSAGFNQQRTSSGFYGKGAGGGPAPSPSVHASSSLPSSNRRSLSIPFLFLFLMLELKLGFLFSVFALISFKLVF